MFNTASSVVFFIYQPVTLTKQHCFGSSKYMFKNIKTQMFFGWSGGQLGVPFQIMGRKHFLPSFHWTKSRRRGGAPSLSLPRMSFHSVCLSVFGFLWLCGLISLSISLTFVLNILLSIQEHVNIWQSRKSTRWAFNISQTKSCLLYVYHMIYRCIQ